MKALKEKRLSLRSYLRRGLVILSLFALAFASASCSDSTGDDGDSKDTPPPVQTGPKAVTITVKDNPTNLWFQGAPPDVTGMSIDVKWDNSETVENIKAADWQKRGFFITPSECDVAGPASSGESFYIRHTSGGSTLPYKRGVVPLVGIGDITLPVIYADQMGASLVGQEVTFYYAYNTSAPYADPASGSFATDTQKHEEKVKFNSVYPYSSTYNYGNLNGAFGSGGNYFTYTIGSRGGSFQKQGQVKIGKYMQVVDVRWDDSVKPDTFFAYDDEIGIVAETVNDKLDAKLAGLQFKVGYQDKYTDVPETKTISWADFKARVAYAHNTLHNIDPETAAKVFIGGLEIVKADQVTGEETGDYKTKGANYDLLRYNDDDNTIEVKLEYIPKEYYNAVGAVVWVGTVNIKLPIATYQEISVTRRHLAQGYEHLNWVQEFKTDPGPMDIVLLKAVNDRWVLTGTYELNGAPKPRNDMGFTTKMFYFGYNASGTSINLNPGGAISRQAYASIVSGKQWEPADLSNRDWGLPVRYRNVRVDPEESVLVDIVKIGK